MSAPGNFREFLKDLGFRFLMAALAVGSFIAISFIGDFLEIAFLQSPTGILLVIAFLVSIALLLLNYLN